MSDIRKEPYAEWLEGTLRELVDLHPTSIGVIVINEDSSTGTAYFNIRNRERWAMIQAILQDNLMDFIRVNADIIADILNEGEGDPWES